MQFYAFVRQLLRCKIDHMTSFLSQSFLEVVIQLRKLGIMYGLFWYLPPNPTHLNLDLMNVIE